MTNQETLVQRFHEWVERVCPIEGVTIVSREPFAASFTPSLLATEQEIANANASKAAFDPSDEAFVTWWLAKQKDKAREAVTAQTPTEIANRAALKVVFAGIVHTRLVINAILDKLNATEIERLPIRSWEEVVGSVDQAIQAG